MSATKASALLDRLLGWSGSPARLMRIGRRWAGRIMAVPLRELWRLLVRRLPRDENLVLFGVAGNRFGDNPAYLFVHMAADPAPHERLFWVTDSASVMRRLTSLGLPVVRRHSLRGLRLALRAGWYVVGSYPGDISRWCHDGATVLNLWHGVGVKAIERQITTGPLARVHARRGRRSLLGVALKDDVRRPDYVLSTSPAATRVQFMPAFDVEQRQCLELGYPRTDHFLAGWQPGCEALLTSPSRWQAVAEHPRPVVAYLPTWRDDQFDFLAAEGVTLAALSAEIHAAGGTLLYKPHFNAEISSAEAEHAFILDPGEDVNAYMHLCRGLITDYSSVGTDYLLLDRPILYFVPDIERHLRNRPICFEPEIAMPGPLLRDWKELSAAIAAFLGDQSTPDPFAARRQQSRQILWGNYTGLASSRLAAFIRTGGDGNASARESDLQRVEGGVR